MREKCWREGLERQCLSPLHTKEEIDGREERIARKDSRVCARARKQGGEEISPSCMYARTYERKWTSDERRPRGHQFHTVSCQNKVQTYQFDEINSN